MKIKWYNHDRDANASLNIENEGRKLYNNKIPTRSGELTPVESTTVVDSVKQEELNLRGAKLMALPNIT